MATTTVDQLFSALNESSNAILEAVRSGNERSYRVSKAFLDEAEKGAQGMLDLGKRLAEAPTDLAGLSALAFAKAGDAQRSAQKLARQTFDEVVEAGREARDTFGKIVGANRELGQAYAAAIRGRTGEMFRGTTGGATNSTSTGASAGAATRSTATRRTSAAD